MERKIWYSLIGQFLGMALALFAPAGTLQWPSAWALLAIYSSITLCMTVRLQQANPELLAERLRFGSRPGQPAWDRRVLRLLACLIVSWLVIAGLDRRFVWSRMPQELQLAAACVTAVSLWAAHRLMLENAYLAPTVYVQRDRGHAVVSTGAYGLVRHPFYAVLIAFFFGGSVLLGSWPSALVSLLIALLLAFRCVREERHLRLQLDGYAAYMQRVPRRLIPHVW